MRTRNYIYKKTGVSTSTELKELIRASDGEVFTVICADAQTQGRGRMGRSFFSPEGGIYFSAAFPLKGNEKHASFITLLAGLTVCEALERHCKKPLSIKWPNDIYFDGRKLCGILTEQTKNTAVVGIGINCFSGFPDELKGIAVSLADIGAKPPDKKAFVESVVTALDKEIYENGVLFRGSEKLADEINRRFYLKNKTVTAISEQK